ncbi:hypothetical protein CNMCM5793_004898 [Aspergillus hiratsukae]|uniref:Hydrophobin n=1 Tax=Aspergillus hiratsukae TaxID=1194566 RepID=A0A8H6UAM7_9EURO|nr:hypothetical protein CNMCM5793_004898 [Aspergillus hiratsukae]KAF7163924.1 hypothetical protein CNMCM6106_000696 [Aspergillus hiratsukae]
MKSILVLLPIITLAVAQNLEGCPGKLKCCAGVTPYSALPEEILAEYGVRPDPNANICGNGTAVDDQFDADICESVDHTVQCCDTRQPDVELNEDLTFGCYDI